MRRGEWHKAISQDRVFTGVRDREEKDYERWLEKRHPELKKS